MGKVIENAAGENIKIIKEILVGREVVPKDVSEERGELNEGASEEDNKIGNPHTDRATASQKYNRNQKIRQRNRKIRRRQEKNQSYKAPCFQIHRPANDNATTLRKNNLKVDITEVVMGEERGVIDEVSKGETEVNDLDTNHSSAPKEWKSIPLSRRARMMNKRIRLAKQEMENFPVPLYQIRHPPGSNSAFIPRGDFKSKIYGVRAEPRQNGSNRDAVISWMGEVPTENVRQSNPIDLPSEEFMHNEDDAFYKREFPLKPSETFNRSPPVGMEATDHQKRGDICETANISLDKMEIKDNDEQLVGIAREALMLGMESGALTFGRTRTRDGDGPPEAFVQEEMMEVVGHGRSEYQEETEMVGMDVGSAEKSGRVTRMENIEWGRSLKFLREPLHRF